MTCRNCGSTNSTWELHTTRDSRAITAVRGCVDCSETLEQCSADAWLHGLLSTRIEAGVTQAVIDLWNRNNGWIPGMAFRELAEALGVDPDRLVHYDIDKGERHYPEGVSKR
jgi:hypothetical protein